MTISLGKSCSFGLPRVPFINCCQLMYLVVSLLVLRAGCGIWLYQFLIIAYLFTLLFRILTCIQKYCSHIHHININMFARKRKKNLKNLQSFTWIGLLVLLTFHFSKFVYYSCMVHCSYAKVIHCMLFFMFSLYIRGTVKNFVDTLNCARTFWMPLNLILFSERVGFTLLITQI